MSSRGRLPVLADCSGRLLNEISAQRGQSEMLGLLLKKGYPVNTLSPGPLESSVCQDHSEIAYRRYEMRQALPPFQQRHKRSKNHK
jgi:hypothetical protein